MSSDSEASRPEYEYDYIYDDGKNVTYVRKGTTDPAPRKTTLTYPVEDQTPKFKFVHDTTNGLYVLTFHDGRVERFRDKPARQLMVEPDPLTGAMRPVIRQGNPVYHDLCREEREAR